MIIPEKVVCDNCGKEIPTGLPGPFDRRSPLPFNHVKMSWHEPKKIKGEKEPYPSFVEKVFCNKVCTFLYLKQEVCS